MSFNRAHTKNVGSFINELTAWLNLKLGRTDALRVFPLFVACGLHSPPCTIRPFGSTNSSLSNKKEA